MRQLHFQILGSDWNRGITAHGQPSSKVGALGQFRVTKFDRFLRDSRGGYLLNELTSHARIDRIFEAGLTQCHFKLFPMGLCQPN